MTPLLIVSALSIVDGYSNKDIRYEWEKSDKRIALDNKVKTLPQYNLTTYSTLNLTRQFVAGIQLIHLI